MPLLFLIAILAFPIAEIASMIEVGRHIGLFPTLGLLFLSVILGVVLIRSQSLAISGRLVSALREGRSPAAMAAESGFLVFAGLLFMIPGFVSDALALFLLLPPVRKALANRMDGRVKVWQSRRGPYPPRGDEARTNQETVIDVEFSEVPRSEEIESERPDRDGKGPRGSSPWRR